MFGLAGDAVLPVATVEAAGTGKEKSYPLPVTDGVNIDRSNAVIIVRHANRVYAFSLACPHENAAVKWVMRDQRFFCTKHDSQYTADGTYQTGHATRNLDRFPVRKDGAMVVVSLDRVFRSDANADAWRGAGIDV